MRSSRNRCPAPHCRAQKLPVNIERLQRKFRESTEREQRAGPTLRYTVDVFAKDSSASSSITPEDNVRFGPDPQHRRPRTRT